jgi:tRNA-dihydrouridine synthase B
MVEKGFSYMLAPLEDMSDNAFRTLCFRNGADLTFTEMTRIEGLAKDNANTWQRIRLLDDTPTIIQLLGANEVHLEQFLKLFDQRNNLHNRHDQDHQDDQHNQHNQHDQHRQYNQKTGFIGFNLNLGCPDPDAVKLGYGCALIKRVVKVKKLVSIIRDHGYGVSVKLRLGMNEYEKSQKTYLRLIKEVDADFFIVHARHGRESYDKPADFSAYDGCVRTGKKIIANGDITTKKQADSLKESGLSGVMIGRAAVKNPAIFSSLKGMDMPKPEDIKKEYLELCGRFQSTFRYRKNILKWLEKNEPKSLS